jgi:hypothetical protein
MDTRTRHLFIIGILTGSLWAFSEVVLGTLVRTAALPLRGTVLTGIGVGILFAGFARSKQPWVVGLAVLTAVIAKVVFAPSFGFGIKVINSSTAVLLEGTAVLVAVYVLKSRPAHRGQDRGLAAAVAIACAGTAFYAIGINLAPCAYLKGFSASAFFLRETAPWSLFSAATAPLGYAIGLRWAAAANNRWGGKALPLPALGTIAACWLCCGVTVLLTS